VIPENFNLGSNTEAFLDLDPGGDENWQGPEKRGKTTMSDLWRQQIPGTDLEINYNLSGDDLVVRVNKGPTMVARMILHDAAKSMSAAELMNVSAFSPDFAFRVGDMKEGLQRAIRAAGL
jgi:hypothetical protein